MPIIKSTKNNSKKKCCYPAYMRRLFVTIWKKGKLFETCVRKSFFTTLTDALCTEETTQILSISVLFYFIFFLEENNHTNIRLGPVHLTLLYIKAKARGGIQDTTTPAKAANWIQPDGKLFLPPPCVEGPNIRDGNFYRSHNRSTIMSHAFFFPPSKAYKDKQIR